MLPSGDSTDVIDTFSAPAGTVFLGEDGKSCVQRQFAIAVGPCYAGCTMNPTLWGKQADDCRQACNKKLPSNSAAIEACMPDA